MLLDRDHMAGLGRGGKQGVLVERLDGVHVDDLDGDALGGERVGRLERSGDHEATGDDGRVGALAHHDGAAKFELIVLGVVDHRRGQAAKTQVERAIGGIGATRRSTGLHVVGGDDHRHAGDGAHEGDVLVALVRGAVLAHGNSGMSRADLHIEMRIADGIANLLVGAAGGEHGKGARKGNATGGGDTRGEAHHIALCDAGVIEAIGEGGLELGRLGRSREVGIEDQEVVVLCAKLDQGLAVAHAGGDSLLVCHSFKPPSRARPWPARTVRRWGPCRASPPGPP